jgi:uncharacterized protein YndB with AHSA1/START domain
LGRSILLGVEIHSDNDTVYRAITTKDGLSSFWTPSVVAEPEVGSEATFGFAGAPVSLRMRVTRLDPGSEVAWSCEGDFPFWLGSTVTWSLSPEPEHGGTRVLFRHDGLAEEIPDWDLASVAHTWATILDRLKVLAETGHAEPALR